MNNVCAFLRVYQAVCDNAGISEGLFMDSKEIKIDKKEQERRELAFEIIERSKNYNIIQYTSILAIRESDIEIIKTYLKQNLKK